MSQSIASLQKAVDDGCLQMLFTKVVFERCLRRLFTKAVYEGCWRGLFMTVGIKYSFKISGSRSSIEYSKLALLKKENLLKCVTIIIIKIRMINIVSSRTIPIATGVLNFIVTEREGWCELTKRTFEEPLITAFAEMWLGKIQKGKHMSNSVCSRLPLVILVNSCEKSKARPPLVIFPDYDCKREFWNIMQSCFHFQAARGEKSYAFCVAKIHQLIGEFTNEHTGLGK